MNNLVKLIVVFLMASPFSLFGQAGCGGWGSGPDSLEAIKNHVLYRDYFKMKSYEEAYPFWQYVYEKAPGGSKKHFIDGEKLIKHFYKIEEDSAKKVQLGLDLMDLYDRRIECFGDEGYVFGKKSFDMFYLLKMPYPEIFEVGHKALELEGRKTQSFVIYPFAHVAVEMYKDSIINRDSILTLYENFHMIHDEGLKIVKTQKDSVNFDKAMEAIEAKFSEIAKTTTKYVGIFGCDYYSELEAPFFDSVYSDVDGLKEMGQRLIKSGCGEDSPLVGKIIERVNFILDSTMLPDRRFFNCIKSDDFDCAKQWYQPAMDHDSVSVENKYTINMIMGTKHYRDLNDKPSARKYYIKASKFQPNKAEPIYMIGELYASSGPDCGKGTGWDSQRVVWPAIDKWKRAINIDPSSEFAAKARKKIKEYTKYMPTNEQIHQRNLKEGERYFVPCWIQEWTTIRAYNPFK